jgi:hypothetical protein
MAINIGNDTTTKWSGKMKKPHSGGTHVLTQC